jgi:hypothetical protein
MADASRSVLFIIYASTIATYSNWQEDTQAYQTGREECVKSPDRIKKTISLIIIPSAQSHTKNGLHPTS